MPADFQDSGVISSIWLGAILHVFCLEPQIHSIIDDIFLEDEHSVIKIYQNRDCMHSLFRLQVLVLGVYLVNCGIFHLSTCDVALLSFTVADGGFILLVTLLILETGSTLQCQPWTSFQLGFIGCGSLHPPL